MNVPAYAFSNELSRVIPFTHLPDRYRRIIQGHFMNSSVQNRKYTHSTGRPPPALARIAAEL